MIRAPRSVSIRRLPRLRPALIGMLAGVVVATGCDDPERAEADAPLAPGEFIEVVTAIRETERELETDDSLAFRERKSEILERHGTTEDELRGFVARHGDDVALLQAVWDSISRRLAHVRHDSLLDAVAPDTVQTKLPDPARTDSEPTPLPTPSIPPAMEDTSPRH